MSFFAGFKYAADEQNAIRDRARLEQRQFLDDQEALANRTSQQRELNSLRNNDWAVVGGLPSPQDFGSAAPVAPMPTGAVKPQVKIGKPSPIPDQNPYLGRAVEISEAQKRLSALKQYGLPQAQPSKNPLYDVAIAPNVKDARFPDRTMQAAEERLGILRKLDMQDRVKQYNSPAMVAQRQADAAAQGTSSPYDGLIAKAATDAGIDPEMFKRLIASESSFNPKAVSYGGKDKGYGIAQIAKVHGLSDAQMEDPAVALPFAAKLFGQYLAQSGGNVKEALMRYKGAVSPAGRQSMAGIVAKVAGQAVGAVIPSAQAAPAPQQYQGQPGAAPTPQLLDEHVRLVQMQMAQLKDLAQYERNPATLAQMKQTYKQLQGDIRSAQVQDLVYRAMGDTGALSQLVQLAGLRAAQASPGQFVMLDRSGAAASNPMSARELATYIYHNHMPEGIALQRQIAAKVAEQNAKNRGDIALENVKGGNAAELQRIKGIQEAMKNGYELKFNPLDGKTYLFNSKTGETMMVENQPNKFGATNPTRVPVK